MKIALVDMNYGYSSTGKIVSDLKENYQSKGHSVLVCFGRGPDPEIKGVHKISSRIEVLLHILWVRLTGLTDGPSFLPTSRLIKHIDRFNPDIVHLHDLHGYFINIGAFVQYLKNKNIPVVWTFHCEFMYTGKCGHAMECNKWKTECDQCPRLREYPKSWFFDFTKRMYYKKKSIFNDFVKIHLTAPSNWLADRMSRSIVKDKAISVVYNGLDTSIFKRRNSHNLKKIHNIDNKFLVLSVGAGIFSENKGGNFIIEVAKMFSDSDIVFIVLGADKDVECKLDNVIILPRITDQIILSEYYSMADVLLLTSKRETFSMVAAESLACGTPVVGFDSGAPKEVAPDGYGIFVPYGDLNALYDALKGVKDNSIELNSSLDCEDFAKNRYSVEDMSHQYEEIYKKLLEKYENK